MFNCVSLEDLLKEFGKANQDPFIFTKPFWVNMIPNCGKAGASITRRPPLSGL
jgi:hypothetical protein